MAFIAAAAGKILYGEIPAINYSYGYLALTSWIFVVVAGMSYVGALTALALSVARAIAAGPPP